MMGTTINATSGETRRLIIAASSVTTASVPNSAAGISCMDQRQGFTADAEGPYRA